MAANATTIPTHEEARADLYRILDLIATTHGPWAARQAALAVRVGPGDTPQSNRDLAALLAMLDEWLERAGYEMEVTV